MAAPRSRAFNRESDTMKKFDTTTTHAAREAAEARELEFVALLAQVRPEDFAEVLAKLAAVSVPATR